MRDEKGRFVKGHQQWLGKRRSEETKEKLRIALKGRQPPNMGKQFSAETRLKMRLAKLGKPTPWNLGSKNHFWKGGKTEEVRALRASARYRAWRLAVFTRDRFTCVLCRQVGRRLNADHIKSFSEFPLLRFDVSNGRTLCLECHKNTDTFGWKLMHRRRGVQTRKGT